MRVGAQRRGPGQVRVIDVATPTGPARVDLSEVGTPWAGLVLGHGAGGSVDAPDLVAVTAAALAAGVSVARVTQPYRVAGRRSPAPAPRLDEAWRAVVGVVRTEPGWAGLPLAHGGRSSGARVACRCAQSLDAAGVVALAFPTHPPGRPEQSREDELRAVTGALLVVQGDRDAFGQPDPAIFDGRGRILVTVAGADHALKRGVGEIGEAVVGFLDRLRAGWSRSANGQ